MIVVGLMTGTSMDGLDVAVADLRLDGDLLTLLPLGASEIPWPAAVRSRLLAVLPPATTTVGEICELDTAVGKAGASAAADAISRFAGGRADLIASHGQTVFHWVTDGAVSGTLQLGQPAWIVETTGLPVISDLRARDVSAGGQGAPLASTLDALWLAGAATRTGPAGETTGTNEITGTTGRRAALNLGGIANVTIVGDESDGVIAFDTGPANCLLDAAARRISDGRATADVDGRMAFAGSVRHDLLARLLDEPYFSAPPPKSTGRELFTTHYVQSRCAGIDPVIDDDLMATLTELTAVTVAQACRPFALDEVVASGGGVHNPALMSALARHLDPVPLVTSETRGLPAAGKEAYLIALIGFLSWHGIPGVLPGATGSATQRVLGRISPGNAPLQLPPPAAPPRRLQILPTG